MVHGDHPNVEEKNHCEWGFSCFALFFAVKSCLRAWAGLNLFLNPHGFETWLENEFTRLIHLELFREYVCLEESESKRVKRVEFASCEL